MAGRVLRRWFGRRRGIRIIRLNNKALCSGDTNGHQPRSRSNRWRLVRDASPVGEEAERVDLEKHARLEAGLIDPVGAIQPALTAEHHHREGLSFCQPIKTMFKQPSSGRSE